MMKKDSYIAPFVTVAYILEPDLSLLKRCRNCVLASTCTFSLFHFSTNSLSFRVPFWVNILYCPFHDNQYSLF